VLHVPVIAVGAATIALLRHASRAGSRARVGDIQQFAALPGSSLSRMRQLIAFGDASREQATQTENPALYVQAIRQYQQAGSTGMVEVVPSLDKASAKAAARLHRDLGRIPIYRDPYGLESGTAADAARARYLAQQMLSQFDGAAMASGVWSLGQAMAAPAPAQAPTPPTPPQPVWIGTPEGRTQHGRTALQEGLAWLLGAGMTQRAIHQELDRMATSLQEGDPPFRARYGEWHFDGTHWTLLPRTVFTSAGG